VNVEVEMTTSGSEWSNFEANFPPVRERIRALLIDDDQDDVSMIDKLSRKSKQLDISLTICRSVDDALTALAARKFDIVYVDYWLGLETSIPFIHGFAHKNQTPCVLLTTLDEPDIRRIAFRAGVEGFLSKEEISTQAIESVTLAVLSRRAAL